MKGTGGAIRLRTVITLAVLVIVVLSTYTFFRRTYNDFVAMREEVRSSWAQVENQLQRRNDLIPNYVETVRGYAVHEQEVFTKVAEARAKLAGATTIPDKARAAGELSGLLGRLLLIVERYPELKANQNFIRLQDELAGTENRLAVERRRYNETVMRYNIKVQSFPSMIVARMFGFEPAEFFEVPEAAKAVPKVDFGTQARQEGEAAKAK